MFEISLSPTFLPTFWYGQTQVFCQAEGCKKYFILVVICIFLINYSDGKELFWMLINISGFMYICKYFTLINDFLCTLFVVSLNDQKFWILMLPIFTNFFFTISIFCVMFRKSFPTLSYLYNFLHYTLNFTVLPKQV